MTETPERSSEHKFHFVSTDLANSAGVTLLVFQAVLLLVFRKLAEASFPLGKTWAGYAPHLMPLI